MRPLRYARQSAPLAAAPFALALLAAAPAALAQPTVHGRILASVESGVLTATVQLRTSTGADDLGTTTLRVGFNDAALDPASGAGGGFLAPGTDYAFAAFTNATNPAYGTSTVSYPLAGRIHVNVELNADNAGTVVAGPSAWTDVVTVRFAVTDPAQTSRNVLFAGDQEVYDGDNATLWTPGSFEGADIRLPVELTALAAHTDGPSVRLTWETASETNNAGFHVETRPATGEPAAWRTVGHVAGAGTTAERRTYALDVPGLDPGPHRFRLRQVDLDGTATHSAEVEATVEMTEPARLVLAGPNPFRDRTAVVLTVRDAQHTRVLLVDALGRQVAVVHDGVLTANAPHRFTLDAAPLAPGLYALVAEGERSRAKLLVICTR